MHRKTENLKKHFFYWKVRFAFTFELWIQSAKISGQIFVNAALGDLSVRVGKNVFFNVEVQVLIMTATERDF